MKALLAFVLGIALLAAPVFAQAPTTKLKPAMTPFKAEYNLSACMPKGMAILHVTVDIPKENDGTFTVTHHAVDKNSMVEDKPEDQAIFHIISYTISDTVDGDINADGVAPDGTEVQATFFKDRMVGVLDADEEIISTLYGNKGSIDHAFDGAQDNYNFCMAQEKTDTDSVLDLLDKWLQTGKYIPPAKLEPGMSGAKL